MASTNTTKTMGAEHDWDCTAVADAIARKALGLDTYRYLWAGESLSLAMKGIT